MGKDDRRFPYPRFLLVPFIFVPHGRSETPEVAQWKADHPGWVSFPATFVPRAPEAGQPPLRMILTGLPEPLEFACTVDEPEPHWQEPEAAPWPEAEAEQWPAREPEPPPPPDTRHAHIRRIVPRVLLEGDPRLARPRPDYLRRAVPPPVGEFVPPDRRPDWMRKIVPPPGPQRRPVPPRGAKTGAEAELAAQPEGEGPRQRLTISETIAAIPRRWVAEAEAAPTGSGGGASNPSAAHTTRAHSRDGAASQAQSPAAALLVAGTARTGADTLAPLGSEVAGAARKSPASESPEGRNPKIRGNAQRTRGPNGDAHAKVSLQEAKLLARDPKVRTVHLHQNLRTATGNKSAPRELPDVTGIEAPDEHGITGMHLVEVRSPWQKETEPQAKMNSIGKRLPLGFEARSTKVVKMLHPDVPSATPQAEPAVEPPVTTPPSTELPGTSATELPDAARLGIPDFLIP